MTEKKTDFVTFPPEHAYYLQRTQVLSECQKQLVTWAKWRLSIFTGVTWIVVVVAGFFGGRSMINRTAERVAAQQLEAGHYEELASQLMQASAFTSTLRNWNLPVGSVLAYGGSLAETPPGWLHCDGRALNGNDPRYQALFERLGPAWGSGAEDDDSQTNFNLPDLQDCFCVESTEIETTYLPIQIMQNG